MGIRHLFTFLSKTVANGLLPVDIRKAVEDSRRQKGGHTQPTIVLDLMCMHEHIYMNDHEVLLGGRYEIHNERARHMFSQLKSLGVKIVSFVDGPNQEDKLETVLKRRNDDYESGVKIIQAIDMGLDISGDVSGYKLVHLAPTFLQNFIDIAEEYGEVYISTLNECDQEIALFANRVDALAVISDDTDFLIFEGNWSLWSGRKIVWQNMTTVEYNKSELMNTLSLPAKKMSIFASLGGNDFVKYEMVQDFHRRISYGRNKFGAIADVVRNIKSNPPSLNYLDKNTLGNAVFRPNDLVEGLEALQKSLNFYCLEGIQHKHENALLDRVARDLKRFNYTILGNKVYIFHFIYQDLLKNILTPCFDMTKSIFCRTVGVLQKNENKENITRKCYFKPNHYRPFELLTLIPEYPTCKVPDLMELLYHPYGANDALDDIRWNLLCFIVSSKLNRALLCQIPAENLGNVLTVFYLVEKKEISVDEADGIILSCNIPPEIQDSLCFKEVKRINGRDARLAFSYARLYNIISNCFVAVGLREYCRHLKFDGLCFHSLRKRWSNFDEELKRKILEPLKSLRIYSEDFGLV